MEVMDEILSMREIGVKVLSLQCQFWIYESEEFDRLFELAQIDKDGKNTLLWWEKPGEKDF